MVLVRAQLLQGWPNISVQLALFLHALTTGGGLSFDHVALSLDPLVRSRR